MAAAVRASASVPADTLPAGVALRLRTRATERVGQSLGVIDELRRRAALGTERLASRMRGIRLEADEAAGVEDGDAAAARDAQAAVPVDALGADGVILSRRRR
jgi:hypothetical protein